jgi:hypothetical protein
MSGTPATIHRPAHRLGTTLSAFALDFTHAATGLPKDLTGLSARLVLDDQNGDQAVEWVLDDALKPGLSVPDPQTGRIYVGADAPNPLPLPAGTNLLRGDLKILIGGETFVPIHILIPVTEGPAP